MGAKKMKRWPLFAAIGILLIMLIFAVDGIQRKFIYNDRTAQLQMYYEQLDSVITHRFKRHFRLLTSWTYHLKHQDSTGIESFQQYISSEKRIWDVEDIYLLNKSGRYLKIGGNPGNSGLSQEVIDGFDKIGNQQILKYTTDEGKRQDLFILSVNPGTYMNFDYSAMAMGISITQMKERMSFGNDKFTKTENYLTDRYGNMIISSVSKWKEHDNILEYFRTEGVLENTSYEKLSEKIENRETGSCLIELDDTEYYITYLPCSTLDTMLICLTPEKQAEAGIIRVRRLSLIFLLTAFFVVMLLIFLILRYMKVQDILAVMRTTNDTKTKFLANMSHDFRTPMNATVGYLTLMRENADDPEKVKEYSEKAEAACRNMMGMINSVLDLSKMEVGGHDINREEFSLDELIESLKNDMAGMLMQKNHKLTVDRMNVIEDVFIGDREKIETILVNLLQNAITFTKDSGNIRLVFEEDGREDNSVYLKIKVIDNGIGMSEEFLKHVFDPFERERRQNASKEQGTGLGLAVTRNMVEMLGGTIEAQSRVDEGTTFIVRLKLDYPEKSETELMDEIQETIEQAEAETEPRQDEEKSAFTDMRFLAAEDNELNAEIIVEILNMKGAAGCDVAEDGEKALEVFKNSEPGYYDMILMDIQMPNMDGYQAAAAIRALADEGRDDASKIPILAMSANAFKDDIEKTSESGMDAHIPKPIDNKVFESTVRALKIRGHKGA